jgi:hypothetical protein
MSPDLVIDIIFGALIFIPFVVVPIVVLFIFRMPARPEFSSIAPGGYPVGVLDFFNQNSSALEREGFSMVGDAVQTGFLPNVTTYIRLMVNRQAGDSAMCAWAETKVGDTKKTHKYVEFCTEFSSNKEVNTNNSSTPPAFKNIPEKLLFQFPQIHDVHQLYEIHNRETANFTDRFTRKVLPPQGREIEHLSTSMTKDLDRQVRTGYLFFDRSANVYRPTFKGAFLMTMNSIFGGKKR